MGMIYLPGGEPLFEIDAIRYKMFPQDRPIYAWMLAKQGNTQQGFVCYCQTSMQRASMSFNDFGTCSCELLDFDKMKVFTQNDCVYNWTWDDKKGLIPDIKSEEGFSGKRDAIGGMIHCDGLSGMHCIEMLPVTAWKDKRSSEICVQTNVWSLMHYHTLFYKYLMSFLQQRGGGGIILYQQGKNYGIMVATVRTWIEFLNSLPDCDSRVVLNLNNLRRDARLKYLQQSYERDKNNFPFDSAIYKYVDTCLKPFEDVFKAQ